MVSGDVNLCADVLEKANKAPYAFTSFSFLCLFFPIVPLLTLVFRYNAKTTRKLAVAGAFHSDFMLPAKEALESVCYERISLLLLIDIVGIERN